MIRLLCALGALLVLLVLGENFLREHQRDGRRTAGALRLLTPEPASAIDQIEIHAAGRRWHYIRRGTTWYFPAYHRAFVLNRRVEHLLQSLLATPATFVSTEPGDLGPLWPRSGQRPHPPARPTGASLARSAPRTRCPRCSRWRILHPAHWCRQHLPPPRPPRPRPRHHAARSHASTAASYPKPCSARASGKSPSPATLLTRCNLSAVN